MTAAPPRATSAGKHVGLKLSLVVLSCERFQQTTGYCLATLQRALDDPRIEVILVDNGSTDGSAEHCAAWAREHPQAHYLPMPRDLGFAGAMNVGSSIAVGEWLCLVHGDTMFPPGAIDALLAALTFAPPKVAMLGPVTNMALNGQCLALPGYMPAQAVAAGAGAMRAPTGLFTPSYRTDFFCVAIQRNVWTQLGGLDTSFSHGHLEDFDFSLRLRAMGRDQVIAEDVFVAHLGGATCSGVRASEKAAAQRDRRLLRQRHPQAHFDPARVGNEEALRHIVNVARAKGWTPALRERAAWRYAALLWDEATSPLKRWRWRWTTREVRRALQVERIEPHFPAVPTSPA